MLNRLRHLHAYLYIVATTAAMGLLYAAQSGSPPQSAPANPAQAGAAPTPAVAQAAGNLSMEERIRRLEEQVNLALALKDERIQSLIERSESIYKQLQYVAGFAALALLFFSIRDVILRKKEGERQRGIDDIVKEMMNLQKSAFDQQVRFGALQLAHTEANPSQQFAAIQNVNDVIGVVRQTLAFRLEQE